MIFGTTGSAHLLYMKPNESAGSGDGWVNCSYSPCLTLEQYAKQRETYFTTGSTFVFLPGNHSLQDTVNLTGIANVTLMGDSINEADIIIICRNPLFSFESVTNLSIRDLKFASYGSRCLSILYFRNSSAEISGASFQGTGDPKKNLARAITSLSSNLTITGSRFEGGTADRGGAIYASDSSNLNLIASVFIANRATWKGGAISANSSYISLKRTVYVNNSCRLKGGALHFERGCKVEIFGGNRSEAVNLSTILAVTTSSTQIFLNNTASNGGGIFSSDSEMLFTGQRILFEGNKARYSNGGGMHIEGYSLLKQRNVPNLVSEATELYFHGNKASDGGGAIYTDTSSIILGEAGSYYFIDNEAHKRGGAIYSADVGNITIMGESYFAYNRVLSASEFEGDGSAVAVRFGNFSLVGTATFNGNWAARSGTIVLIDSVASLGWGNKSEFSNNTAKFGAGVAVYSTGSSKLIKVSGTFINNEATDCGGALYTWRVTTVVFRDITASNNTQRAICAIHTANMTIIGSTTVSNNIGGVYSENSFIFFEGYTLFENNHALVGGAVEATVGNISFSGDTIFKRNRADTDGGALHVVGTNIILNEAMTMTMNSAQRGGAMYFGSLASLFLQHHFFETSHNYATQYGGAIYHEDATHPTQCNYVPNRLSIAARNLPSCFLKIFSVRRPHWPGLSIMSYNDTAILDGNFLYGGLLDKCLLHTYELDNAVATLPYKLLVNLLNYTEAQQENVSSNLISSPPYQLCSCENETNYNCSAKHSKTVYRGQMFAVSLVVIAQGNTTVPTEVTAKVSSTGRVQAYQNSQHISKNCTTMSYNLYSTASYEELLLYPDGPCRDTGLAKTIIHVEILPCPDGFSESDVECVCDNRLREVANCTINDLPKISKRYGSTIWVSGIYTNGSYEGLITAENCPFNYCKTMDLSLSLENPDIQCDLNRSRLLCGACTNHYSLMLGSSKCTACSNAYLSLLIPFAVAGIALVVFLSVLRLTVATGMINSVILFANIVQVNKHIFLPEGTKNILTVFIAWLNLDLGIETCFYNGMSAYDQTWLQFTFPVYLWVIMCLIILTSRYSITVSKLIGHNPVAVLATLLLISYTKLLRVIIEVYSYAELRYPNKTVAVWRKDANVPYLHSKHLALTVVTTLVLVFFFLPYTFLLLIGHKLYRYSGRKYFRWFQRVRPLLDSYYAPYKKHTCYWTGLLLLVRCALYIVFSLVGTNNSLLVIIFGFSIIITTSGYFLSGRVYNKVLTNILEVVVYLKLVLLSAVYLAGFKSQVSVYLVVSAILFIITMAIIAHHIYIRVVSNRRMKWPRVAMPFHNMMSTTRNLTQSSTGAVTPSKAAAVTSTTIDLRETLLESDNH